MSGAFGIRATFFAILMSLVASGATRADEPGDKRWQAANFSRHFSGPEIAPRDLEGKVVLVEYFIFGCGPCRRSLPGLVNAVQEHGADETFAIVISVQGAADEKGRAYLEEQVPTIPVYQGLDVPGAPSSKSYPNGHLFDHRGTLVASGGPGGLLKQVGALVASVPGLTETPLFDGAESSTFSGELKALRGSVEGAIEGWQAIQAEARGNGNRAVEAKEILVKLREWLAKERLRLEFVSARRPAEVAWQAQQLFDRFEGFDRDHDKKLAVVLKAVRSQRGVARYLSARRDLLLARGSSDDAASAEFKKRAMRDLDALLRDERAASNIKNAARLLRSEFADD